MVDLTVLAGTVGALGGVALGSWLTARSQRTLLRESHLQARIEARELAYSEFLGAYRQFRRYIMNEPVNIRLVERSSGRPAVPIIDGSAHYWEAVENATARLVLLAGDRMSPDIWNAVRLAFYDIARARAIHEPGAVPDEIIHASRSAEYDFARVAREDLLRP
jgi:hypothetical protein